MGILEPDTEPVTLPRLDLNYAVETVNLDELRIVLNGEEIARLFGGNVPVIVLTYTRLQSLDPRRANDFIAGVAYTATHHAMAVYQGDRGGVELPPAG